MNTATMTSSESPTVAPIPRYPAVLVSSAPSSIPQQPVELTCRTGEHQAIPIGGGCFAYPTVVIPESHRKIWKNEVKDRFEDEIKQKFRFDCHLELSVVSDTAGRKGVCILLLCWPDDVPDRPGAVDRLQRDLQKKMCRLQANRDNPFPCRVVIENIVFAAPRTQRPFEQLGIMAQYSPGGRRNYNSVPITSLSSPDLLCSLGGVVQIGNKIRGLTVAHAFTSNEPRHVQDLQTTSHGPGDHDEYSPGDDSDDSDSDFVFEEEQLISINDTIEEVVVADAGQRHSDAHISLLERMVHPTTDVRQIIPGSTLTTATLEAALHFDTDWALIKFDAEPETAMNSYYAPDKASEVLLKDSYTDKFSPNHKVLILTCEEGAQQAVIGQTDIQIIVSGLQLEVTQVVLSKPLVRGSSGIWVVQGDLIMGCIVAIRQFAPIAYMTSMKRIAEELTVLYTPEKVSFLIEKSSQYQPNNQSESQRRDYEVDTSLQLEAEVRRDVDQSKAELQRSSSFASDGAEASSKVRLSTTTTVQNDAGGDDGAAYGDDTVDMGMIQHDPIQAQDVGAQKFPAYLTRHDFSQPSNVPEPGLRSYGPPFPYCLWVRFHSIGISEPHNQVLKVGDYWSPPEDRNAFMPRSYDRDSPEHQTTFRCWGPEHLQPYKPPGSVRSNDPSRLKFLRASTLFWSTQRYGFLHLPYDCRKMNTGKVPDKSWAPLSFEPAGPYHASGTEIWKVGYHLREPQICSGINMSDSLRALFGPTCFKEGDRTLNTLPICDLTGDISILLGLAAFAAPGWQDLPSVVNRLFRPHYRNTDNKIPILRDCGQIHDRRGLVVEVYYDEHEVRKDTILEWEDGAYGPILTSSRLVREARSRGRA